MLGSRHPFAVLSRAQHPGALDGRADAEATRLARWVSTLLCRLARVPPNARANGEVRVPRDRACAGRRSAVGRGGGTGPGTVLHETPRFFREQSVALVDPVDFRVFEVLDVEHLVVGL